jgi:hypothetical protein
MDNSNERPLFQGMDELERTYAPEELSPDDPEFSRVIAEQDPETTNAVRALREEPPGPAPVANLGSSPSGEMAPPNIGHEDHGGAPGDPETQARDPFGPGDEADRDR